jgi:hypothetical protein
MVDYPRDTEADAFRGNLISRIDESEREMAEALLRVLFPRFGVPARSVYVDAAEYADARRQRRVQVPDAFDLYFGLRLQPDAIGSAEMEQHLALAADEDAFAELLLQLSAEKRSDGSTRAEAVLDRLLDYTDQLVVQRSAAPLLRALLRDGNRLLLTDTVRSRLGFGVELSVSRLLFQLLPALDPADRLPLFTDSLAPALGSTVLQLYRAFEHDTSVRGTGRELFSEEETAELKGRAVEAIQQRADDGTLNLDPQFPFVLYRWRDWASDTESMGGVTAWLERYNEANIVEFLRSWRQYAGHFDPNAFTELVPAQHLLDTAMRTRSAQSDRLDRADLDLLDEFIAATRSFIDATASRPTPPEAPEAREALATDSDLRYWVDQIASRGHALIRRLEKTPENSPGFPGLREEVRDYVGEMRGPAIGKFNAGDKLLPRAEESRLLDQGGTRDYIRIVNAYVDLVDQRTTDGDGAPNT